MMSNMTHRLDTISDGFSIDPATNTQDIRRQPLANGDPASVPPSRAQEAPHGPEALADALKGALDNYRRSIEFSIKAQVASTSSTATMRTFNSLMKGS
jgi:hypothetical protein